MMSIPDKTKEKLRKYSTIGGDATVHSIKSYLERGVSGAELDLEGVSLENLDEVRDIVDAEALRISNERSALLKGMSIDELLEALYDFGYESGQNSAYDCYPRGNKPYSTEDVKNEILSRVSS